MIPRRVGALASVFAVLVFSTPPATAEPPVEPPVPAEAPAGSTTLSLADLGTSGTISFNRINPDNAGSSVSFPVPAGLTPVALRANIELPMNLRFGNVSASQADRTLSRIGLPPQDGAEVIIPLPGVRAAAGFATVNFKMAAVAQEPYCWDPEAPIRLANAAVVFAGAEAPPRSVAEFLSPVLRRVVIAMPANPSLAESTAAVRVATAVARRNSQRIDVDVIRLPEGRTVVDLPPAPLTREIVVKEGPEKGLSLQGGSGVPSLLISGQGDDLPAQAQLLHNDVLRFAAGSKSASGPLLEDQLLGLDTTLKEMTGSGVTGQSNVVIDINQTKFGQPLRDIRVHLVGSHTPLPDNAGGEIIVSLAGEIIDRWPATPDGVIDRSVVVPDRLVDRVIGLQIGVRTTTSGEQGGCTPLSIPLRVDGSTGIRASGANPPVPQGFQSLPQALMPAIPIGIGPDTFGDTVRAIRIMVGLQRVSDVPLMPRVESLEDALAAGGSAVLISSNGWENPSLILPFGVNGNQISVQGVDSKGQSVTLDLDSAGKFGSLQTVFDGRRSLLVATSAGAPAQLDGLLNWLAAERGRWADLNGQAIIAVEKSEPITIPNPIVAQSGSFAESSARQWHWPVLGGIAVAAVAAAAAAFVIRRRSR